MLLNKGADIYIHTLIVEESAMKGESKMILMSAIE